MTSSDLTAGAEIAGYRVESVVGRGGMGVVYRAQQLRLGRTVALKVLPPALAADETFRERFERESRLAALIDHPNIVPIYEADEAGGLLFISMRWVDGRDLRAILAEERRLGLDRTLDLLEQVGSALDAAHERGLVHRDVKPANVLVSGAPPSEHAYLTDFGIAKMASSRRFTRTGMFLGTPDYAAPEQFEGKELDGRADVYALGCLLFQCLTGARPFERTQELAVMYAHLNDPPPRVTEERPDLPPALDGVIAKAMAKQRSDRYATCRDLIDAARAAAREARAAEAAPATTPAGPTVAAPAAAGPTIPAAARPAPPPAPPPRRPARSRRLRWLAAAAAVAAIAGVAVAVVLVTGGDGGETPAGGGADETAAARTAEQGTAAAGGGTTAAATETAATDTAATETAAAGTALAALPWTLVDSPSLSGEAPQELQAVAAGAGEAALAAGSTGLAGERNAAFWTLAPGDPDAEVERQVLEAEGEEVAYGLAATADGAVAVGFRQAAPPVGDTAAAVWVQRDGAWSAAGDGLGEAPFEKMNAVATGADGTIVAVGAAGPGRAASGTPLETDAAAWISRDGGLGWERTESDALTGEGYLELRGVAAFGDGFVAVGYDRKDAAAWRFDGSAWERAPFQGSLAAGGGLLELDMRAVVPFGQLLVAVGDVVRQDGERDGAVWLSEDGLAWTAVTARALGGPGDQQILAVAATDAGLFAVGCSGCRPDESEPAVWTSADGRAWERTDPGLVATAGAAQQANDLAAAGEELVGVGWDEADGVRRGAVWLASASG